MNKENYIDRQTHWQTERTEYYSALRKEGVFPGGPGIKNPPSREGAWVRSLVGELRSHMPSGTDKKKEVNSVI